MSNPRGLFRVRIAMLASILLAPALSGADVLSGTVTIRARAGVAPALAVVYAESLGAATPTPVATSFSIAQRNKTFVPRVLGVPVGAVVNFPNEDQIFHNVFSLAPGNVFDLGLYRAGATKSRTMATPGLVRVFCNIHPQMTALIVAAPTPWITTAGADGTYRLELPAGRYTVTALSERASAASVDVVVSGATSAPSLSLDETAFVSAPHTNKFGKPYPDAAYKQP